MKILLPSNRWEGGTHSFFGNALLNLGHEVEYCYSSTEKKTFPISYYLKLRQIKKVESYINNKLEVIYNKVLIDKIKSFKPDIFLSLNYYLFPETLKFIKNSGIITVCFIGDNPFDSTRFKYFPIALEYFNYLFLGEKIWEQNIRNVTPRSKIFHFVGAFDKSFFKPLKTTPEDITKYSCNISFAGSAYGMKAEATYRVAILNQICDFGLKFWGDANWESYFKYYPNLKNAYQGNRLNFDELNKLYQITKININIPNPQCFTAFQQRTFEIAAAKGFQIVDYRSDIDEFFNEDEIVTFKNISELKEKIECFLKHPEKRLPYIEKAFIKVWDKCTYENRIKEMFQKINI